MKIEDLSIWSDSKPTFDEVLHVNTPVQGCLDQYTKLIESTFKNKIFTNNGPYVRELSESLSKYLTVDHCVLTNNGTTAMSILIKTLDLKGEVVLPSFTFISTAHTLIQCNLTPVFSDINPISWNIDLHHCESLITEKTSAIIATHLWGNPCEISKLEELANKYGLALIFDAAHSFGNKYNGKLIGNFGSAEVFSFHATKLFHTFEGGAITTNDEDLASKLEKYRNFGFSDYDQVESIGTNAKMTESCAAMGIINLIEFEDNKLLSRDVYKRYLKNLGRTQGLHILNQDLTTNQTCQYIVLEIEEEEIGLSRDEIQQILIAENVLARRYFYPGTHNMVPYSRLWPNSEYQLPVTNNKSKKCLLLPGSSTMEISKVDQVCSLIQSVTTNGWEIRCRLDDNNVKLSDCDTKSLSKLKQRRIIIKDNYIPKVEFRIPISATSKYLRMIHYFLESLKLYGGPIGSQSKCVFSVSRDCPKEDLFARLPWASDYNIDFHWIDQEMYDKDEYDATGYHRFYIKSDADIIILADADILIGNNFDNAILSSFHKNQVMGCIAHVSPFSPPPHNQHSSLEWWTKIFDNVDLETPKFKNVHTGWGLMNKNKNHRTCPNYFNYGFIIVPQNHLINLSKTFVEDLRKIEQVLDTWFKSQIATTVGFQRYKIPCKELSLNYNFPMHVPDLAFRSLNPDPCGEDLPSDIKIFHYLGFGKFNREDFISTKALELAIDRKNLTPTETVFREKLIEVHRNIQSENT